MVEFLFTIVKICVIRLQSRSANEVDDGTGRGPRMAEQRARRNAAKRAEGIQF